MTALRSDFAIACRHSKRRAEVPLVAPAFPTPAAHQPQWGASNFFCQLQNSAQIPVRDKFFLIQRTAAQLAGGQNTNDASFSAFPDTSWPQPSYRWLRPLESRLDPSVTDNPGVVPTSRPASWRLDLWKSRQLRSPVGSIAHSKLFFLSTIPST